MSGRQPSPVAECEQALAVLVGDLRPGTWSDKVITGDLVIEYEVRVRRRIDPSMWGHYIDRALAELGRRRFIDNCGEVTARKSRFSGRSACCTKPISAVVVSAGGMKRDRYEPARLRFRFCCGVHAPAYEAAPETLAVLALPAAQLRVTRELVERRAAKERTNG